ncbi:MAG: PAS domain-containing protein, partial [Candidatus Thermoplasmatota archaeon]|nr:PAS domain-containing protein [Candidatus Thermoplasmatota archaeon]
NGWTLPMELPWWEMNVKTNKISYTKNKFNALGNNDDFRQIDYKKLMNLIHPDDYQKVKLAMKECLDGKRQLFDVIYRLKEKNGRYSWWYDKGLIVERDQNNDPLIMKGVSIDVSKLKQSQNLEKLSHDVLNCLNESNNQLHQIQDIIAEIKDVTDFEAVGIRIKKKNHYPYYETKGFPGDFIQKATHICRENEKSTTSENPIYECMCGKIIAQEIDFSFYSLSCFTENGSFWTNNLLELLKRNPENIKDSFTRNNCIEAEFRSVALIPIKNKELVIGLIQINDTRENILSYELIRTLESIGSSIGIAFARDEAIQEMKTNERRFRLAQKAADIGTWDWDITSSELTWSEKIEPMFGFEKGEFDGTYDAFLNRIHQDDREFVEKSVDNCLEKKKHYAIEHRIVLPDETIRWVSERGNVIRDKNEKPIRMLGVVQDITQKKEMEKELKKRKNYLKTKVQESTAKLVEANKKLKQEISEKKKTQQYLERTKNNLRNVIDSATEFIVSFDMMNRISIWNKTAENLTRYKQLDVLNRSIGKLKVFDNPEKILEHIKLISKDRAPETLDIVLKTKDNDTRVIRASGSKITGANSKWNGSLFMGKDITDEVAVHKKLLAGNSYLITDQDLLPSLDLLSELTNDEFSGLIVTRGNPDNIKKQVNLKKNLKIALFTKKPVPDAIALSNLESLEKEIYKFTKQQKKPVILLDGIHYLLSNFSFEAFIKLLYDINDIIVEQKAILFVRIDPSTIHTYQMAIIRNELITLPGQETEDIIIRDNLFDLIKYIYKQNQANAIVSVKKVMTKFEVTYVTAASRIDSLEEKGLIYSKKEGKIRAVFATSKGKRLIHKRKTV